MYAVDFRKAVLQMYHYFQSLRKVSICMKVSIASISRWNNKLYPKIRIRVSPKTSHALKCYIETLVSNNPLLTCSDLCKLVHETFFFKVSRQLVNNIIRSIGFSYKRVKTRVQSPKKEALTSEFIKTYKNLPNDANIVSIDESGFDQRVYGYSKKGEQAIVHNTYCKDRNRYNLLLGVSNKGNKQFFITSDNINGIQFSKFIMRLPYPKGTYLLMDNHRIHRTYEVRNSIISKGYIQIFTPPYSPEFNPIELVFGIIKSRYYKERLLQSFSSIKKSVYEITNCINSTCLMSSFKHVEQYFVYTNHLTIS